MKKKLKKPFPPPVRYQTIRHEIISALENRKLTAKDISSSVKISEKDVYEHLEHIQKTTSKSEHHLIVIPAECIKCGFLFRKREKLKKPGKCPICRGEQISDPIFSFTGISDSIS